MHDYSDEEYRGAEVLYMAWAREHQRHNEGGRYLAFADAPDDQRDSWAATYRAAMRLAADGLPAPVSPRFHDTEAATKPERTSTSPVDPDAMKHVHRRPIEPEPGHLDTVSYRAELPTLASAGRLMVGPVESVSFGVNGGKP